MAVDCKNLRKSKKKPALPVDNGVEIKQPPRPKDSNRVRFIITKNKYNSWVDDLHALEQLNQVERVYH